MPNANSLSIATTPYYIRIRPSKQDAQTSTVTLGSGRVITKEFAPVPPKLRE